MAEIHVTVEGSVRTARQGSDVMERKSDRVRVMRKTWRNSSMKVHPGYPTWKEGTCHRSMISNCDGCRGQSLKHHRVTTTEWRRHFSEILNIQSQSGAAELEIARQKSLRPRMADTPSKEEKRLY